MFASFQVSGKMPSFSDLLNMVHSGCEMYVTDSCNSLWLMPSIPHALRILRVNMMSCTSCCVISIFSSVLGGWCV